MPGVDFEQLLHEAIGLDAASLGPTAISRAVAARQAACRIDDAHAYWLRVRSSPTELQELIEAVVVPETWFFRDPAAFDALAGMARSVLVENPARTELRLLSLPCSSGEEPFSMAIALLDAGLPANRIRIDGVDISARVIELASRAAYGVNSFRGKDLSFRERHFRAAAPGKWQLSDAVRTRVRFQQGNLFAPDFLPGRGIYDMVFCRNVLIYFDQETQLRALQVLLRLLAPGGCLFVGPSETGLLPRDRFASAQLPMSFAYRLLPERSQAAPVAATRKRAAPAPVARRARRAPAKAAPANEEAKRGAAPSAEAPTLARVQALADQGKLAEAHAAGDRLLRERGPSADGYCLLGTIRSASGDEAGADAYYRKALYLDPKHRESLAHLALLLEATGRAPQAKVLRTRLHRLDAKAAP